MAITKLLHMKERSSGNKSLHLKNSIDYILNPEKTDDGFLVGGNAGHTKEMAYEKMMQTKRRFGKEDGRQGYHFILSFPPGEVSEAIAYEITQKFCDEYFSGDKYDHVFAIHNDREHLHGHIIFNSIDNIEGKKYHYKKGDWEKYIQTITNRLCEEYGLETIGLGDLDKTKNEEKEVKRKRKNPKEKNNYNWNRIMREDIDGIIFESNSYQDFLEKLQKAGYTIRSGVSTKYNQEYFSMHTEGMGISRRNYRLGEAYTVEKIKERIENKEPVLKVIEGEGFSPIIKNSKAKNKYYYKMSPVQRQLMKRIFGSYRTRKRFVSPYPQAYKYKKDLVELNKLMENYNFVHDNKIATKKDLQKTAEHLIYKKKTLEQARNALCYQIKSESMESVKDKKEKLKNLHRELVKTNADVRKCKDAESYLNNVSLRREKKEMKQR
ncbi:hypothetical protein M2150_001683 [Lachnospiraceae bacterium PM6-15]|uniref:relaxase/mobilization nuclease domain-containing protein n=1 Tax=Ohessyouella blattaphilus TaxID=2949333 RepID=UPI003E1E5E31